MSQFSDPSRDPREQEGASRPGQPVPPRQTGRFSQPRTRGADGRPIPQSPAGQTRPAAPAPQPRRQPGPQRPQDPTGTRRPPVGQNPRPVRRPPAQPGAPRPAAGEPPRRRPPASDPRRTSSGGRPPRRPAPSRKQGRSGPNLGMLIVIGLLILGSLGLLMLCFTLSGSGDKAPDPQSVSRPEDLDMALDTVPTEKPEKKPFWKGTEATEVPTEPPVQLVSTAKVTVTGDLLIHKSLINQASEINKGDQGYNFDSLFKFLGGYTDTADFAVANLETTLFGPGKPYSGNPKFNTPDQLVDGAKKAGFDMLLTANNHCNDTDLDGVLRTLKVVREKGLLTLGTNLSNEEDKYVIQDINGIRLGMLCYTYEDSRDPNQVTFNYNPLPAASKDLVCSFPKFQDAKSRDPFYQKLGEQISEMKEKGAEAIVMFLHWGEEYHLEASQDQKTMAQKLCDMGVDLIVGGHPHVVQPVELLTSTTDPDHRTVCLYSLGNAVSNQRKEEMTNSCPTGHTEDGMLFNFTFEKYSDGTVRLGSVDVIPTWVNLYTNAAGKREYNILPLEDSKREQWQTMFSIAPGLIPSLEASYKRTMDIVGPGLTASNAWLSGEGRTEPLT